jgi:hypothetical protein
MRTGSHHDVKWRRRTNSYFFKKLDMGNLRNLGNNGNQFLGRHGLIPPILASWAA